MYKGCPKTFCRVPRYIYSLRHLLEFSGSWLCRDFKHGLKSRTMIRTAAVTSGTQTALQSHLNRIRTASYEWNFSLPPVKVKYDVSNVSNIQHLYDVAHHVAIVHMANDKCQASNVGTRTHSATCWILSHIKGYFQCWNANCGYCWMFASNVGLFDASCSR